MTCIHNDPDTFAEEALAGFAALNGAHVRLARGGVLRSTAVPDGKVSLVVGGGSGHFPTFAGFVGPGLADAAVAGNVFASPSTAGIARICRLAHRGGGILLGFGNYAGDVLNFGLAAERLRGEGLDVRVLTVTDDVASAPPDQPWLRRGIAGFLANFKIIGSAADAGLSLDEVERIARHVNSRTVSFGVAFKGCTLPGSAEPLFTVPKGRMAIGLGIHGEPGISETDILPASGLAALLVDRLVAERPAGSNGRVGVILNGLGSTKFEELFVLWNGIADGLARHGLEVVGPISGEFATSLDMAGCSLTLTFLDDELEHFWLAPCSAPVMHRGQVPPTMPAPALAPDAELPPAFGPAAPASTKDGACIARLLATLSETLKGAEDELGLLDTYAGDGDHGQGMARGAAAATAAAEAASKAGAGAASVLASAGDAWADRAGGTSGAIWGLLLRAWSTTLSDETALDNRQVIGGARAGLDAVMRLGGAKAGDKTLVDALIPFVETLEAHVGADLAVAWAAAAQAATDAAVATAALSPKLGRARPLAERSIGHADAGATSLALCARTVAGVLKG